MKARIELGTLLIQLTASTIELYILMKAIPAMKEIDKNKIIFFITRNSVKTL